MTRNRIILSLALLLTLAACDKGPDNDSTPPPPVPSATTLAAFMATLFGTTSETALPVDINGLNLDTSSEDPSQFTALII